MQLLFVSDRSLSFIIIINTTNAFYACFQTHKVQKCLQKLLRSLHKDRHHTIAHYRHLLASSIELAEREKSVTLEHLVDIDHMVNQSLQMLYRYALLKKYYCIKSFLKKSIFNFVLLRHFVQISNVVTQDFTINVRLHPSTQEQG